MATPLSRRSLLAAGTAAIGIVAGRARAQPAAAADLSAIKALAFDVYGTCTDHWGTIVSEGQALNRARGLDIDWPGIADDWRGLFPPNFQAVLRGQRPWQSFASLRREALEGVLRARGITSLGAEAITAANAVWQRLQPWPDTVAGLHRLKPRFLLASLSNADMADMVRLAKLRDLPWDMVLAAELAEAVKPDPRVYQLAMRYLGLRPEEILMVACHKADLRAARAQGMRTAFIARPLELGPNGQADARPEPEFDLNATSFLELADLLRV